MSWGLVFLAFVCPRIFLPAKEKHAKLLHESHVVSEEACHHLRSRGCPYTRRSDRGRDSCPECGPRGLHRVVSPRRCCELPEMRSPPGDMSPCQDTVSCEAMRELSTSTDRVAADNMVVLSVEQLVCPCCFARRTLRITLQIYDVRDAYRSPQCTKVPVTHGETQWIVKDFRWVVELNDMC